MYMHGTCMYSYSTWAVQASRELHGDKLIEKSLFEIMIVATHWSGAVLSI